MFDQFDKLFDLDGNGDLDSFEEGAKFGFISEVLSDNDKSDELEDELSSSGLDIDELELMDEDERREAFEDVGIDPDDFDF